jgi:hypothetical protein
MDCRCSFTNCVHQRTTLQITVDSFGSTSGTCSHAPRTVRPPATGLQLERLSAIGQRLSRLVRAEGVGRRMPKKQTKKNTKKIVFWCSGCWAAVPMEYGQRGRHIEPARRRKPWRCPAMALVAARKLGVQWSFGCIGSEPALMLASLCRCSAAITGQLIDPRCCVGGNSVRLPSTSACPDCGPAWTSSHPLLKEHCQPSHEVVHCVTHLQSACKETKMQAGKDKVELLDAEQRSGYLHKR